jgi:hypothetical protein
MNWIAFSSSLPPEASSSPRVALWRRLQRLGAISPTSGLYLLPATNECIEAFQWLAQEVRHAQGQALVMYANQVEGLGDQQLVELFQQARREEYAQLRTQTEALADLIRAGVEVEERPELQAALEKLHRQYAAIKRTDYFDCPEGTLAAAALARIAESLSPRLSPEPEVEPATLAAYQDKRWVTRPQPHVDRLAGAWLIRRFIDPEAAIRYAERPEPGEVAFDMSQGRFGHQGNLCTFEVMIRAFSLDEPALYIIADIVHEIDLHDGLSLHPETAGVEAVLKGWSLANLSDAELEGRGIALYDGLFAALSHRLAPRREGG